MVTLKHITDEIEATLRDLREQPGTLIHKQLLISVVMDRHNDFYGVDRDFALCCERYTIEQQVDRYFRSIKQAEMDLDTGDLLPGFEYLQKRYIVNRSDVQVIVLVGEMTDEELIAKAAEHHQMGVGHLRHEAELLQFMEERRRARAMGV